MMLNWHNRLSPKQHEVAAKVIDGEAIMINLSNGVYYSMDKVGGMIWELIDTGHNMEEMVAAITARYEVTREQVQADVERLVAELIEENLVQTANDRAPVGPQQIVELAPRLTYEPPRLNIYRDMSDLLALDPPIPGLEETPWKESAG
jgi:hypothetical protein